MTEAEYNEAIQTTDKNLRIIACAGSGKTTFVAKRIAHLLETGTQPENIIAFTYTEKAAAELNNRVVKELKDQNLLGDLLGFADMYIGTIHGWCLKALLDNEIGYQKFSVLDEIKLRLFVDKNYKAIGMTDIRKLSNPGVAMKIFTDTDRFVQLMNIIRESQVKEPLSKEIAVAKKKYEKTLRDAGYFDFTMIMTEVLEKLIDPASALYEKISSNLKYLIVDEFQDVNPIQEKIIGELHSVSKCNVTVVGDDDQNIYQWRGSNSKFLQEFDEKYSIHKPVISLHLAKNYRSSKGITAVAKAFIEKNRNRIPKDMSSADKQEFVRDEDILFNDFESISEENLAIINRIKNLRGVAFQKDGEERGLDYSDFCILLRTWSKSESIVAELELHGIPYVTGGVNQLFSTKEVKASVGIYQYLNDDLERDELYDLWSSIANCNISDDKLELAIQNLDKWLPDSFQSHRSSVSWGDFILQEIFWQFLSDSEITEESFIGTSDESQIQAEIIFYNLGKFSQVINDYETINLNSSPPSFHLFNFLNFIKYAAKDYYPEGWMNNPYKTPNAVQIMTVHQAKGLEYPVVFIPGINKNYLPLKKPGGLNVWHFLERESILDQDRYEASSEDQRFEDERRLLYVAITRSQKFLFVSRAPDHSNRLYKQPSPFIKDLVSDYMSKTIHEVDFRSRKVVASKPKEESVNISLNFSLLKDFFQCNYRFKLVSMYGFCFPLNMRMGLGKSLHDSLMAIHKKASEGVELNKEELESIAEEQLHFPYLGKSPELQKMKEDVKKKTVEYYEKNQEGLKAIEFVEQDIKLNLDDGVFVSGRIDLIKKKIFEDSYETYIMEFKSNDHVQSKIITEHQLILYALGYRDLVGQNADYIQVYDVEKNELDHKTPVTDDLLKETESNIQMAATNIRNQNLRHVNEKVVCSECFQNRICSARLELNVPSKK